jgi:HEPN domain-containing protein
MQAHEAWLLKAENDLIAAKLLIENDRTLDTAIYLAHQCAEKSLKGFLVLRGYQIQKTHNLIHLLELCYDFDGQFWTLLKEVKYLNPFSVKFRYPADFLSPETTQVEEALRCAEKIFQFVQSRVSN